MPTTPNLLPARRPELLLMPDVGGDGLVEDRSCGEQYRLGEQEYFLLARLDGAVTSRELRAAYEKQFGQPLTEEEVADFLEAARPLLLPEPSHATADALAGEIAEYSRQFADCATLDRRSRAVIAGAATHDRRNFGPHPVYVERAEGPYKWTAAGKRLIDYWTGHGSLLFGHGFGPVVEAVSRQIRLGTHPGAGHETEVRWAERICQLVPSAQRVRFTASGTEATQLALRVARAYTGRPRVVKFHGHFHGWHDEAMAHFYPRQAAGFGPGVLDNSVALDPTDLDPLAEVLAAGDVAGVLLEPGGGGSGGLDWQPGQLQQLREQTRRAGTLLIFDEVISGFRYAPGGVQQLTGVTPDLTTLAKILCGGLPGGAVAGRADVMAVFGPGTTIDGRRAQVPHTGTFNGNPLSAAAGVAMLGHVGDGVAQRKACEAADLLAGLVNRSAELHGLDVRLVTHGTSVYHILIGATRLAMSANDVNRLHASHPERYARLRRALLVEGVDSPPLHGWVSAVHGEVAAEAAEAFNRVFARLRDEAGFRL